MTWAPEPADSVPGPSCAYRASDLVRRPWRRQFHRAPEHLAGVSEVDLRVGPRGDVGEYELARARAVRRLACLAAVEVQVRDVLLAVRERGLAEEQVGFAGELVQRVAGAGVTGVRERLPGVLDPDAVRLHR